MSPNETPETDFPPKLASPVRRALHGAGYFRLDQLTQISEKELLKMHGVGPKGIEQLRVALAEKGLSFRTDG
ncbi:MAG: DNA-binding protein [bacterium]|nr:DNA-binding protein [bacterium]